MYGNMSLQYRSTEWINETQSELKQNIPKYNKIINSIYIYTARFTNTIYLS